MRSRTQLLTLLQAEAIVVQPRRCYLQAVFTGIATSLLLLALCLKASGQVSSNAGLYAVGRNRASERINEVRIFSEALHDFVDDQRSEGWAGIDALDVIWLGEAPPPSQSVTTYTLPQAGQPLRMRNWLRYGEAGAAVWSNFSGAPVDYDATINIERSPTFKYRIEQDRIGLAYGFGILGTQHSLQLDMEGSILDGVESKADIENYVVGPKVGVVAQRQIGSWAFDLQGMFMLGTSVSQVDKTQLIGKGLIPGALNQPLYFRPTYYSEQESSVRFSPVGEIRANASLRMSSSLFLRTECSSMFVQNFLDADGTFSGLPRIALGVDQEGMAVHNVFVGLEYLQ